MSDEPNTRLSGMKQDIQDIKTKFTQSLAALCGSMDQKFENINSQLINMKCDLTKNMEDIVNDSLSRVCQKVESLESRISELETDSNKQDQHNRRNNLEIQKIPLNISDNILEVKVIQIFEGIDISVTVNDTEDSHHLGKSGNNTIVRPVNRRIFKKALEKKGP